MAERESAPWGKKKAVKEIRKVAAKTARESKHVIPKTPKPETQKEKLERQANENNLLKEENARLQAELDVLRKRYRQFGKLSQRLHQILAKAQIFHAQRFRCPHIVGNHIV